MTNVIKFTSKTDKEIHALRKVMRDSMPHAGFAWLINADDKGIQALGKPEELHPALRALINKHQWFLAYLLRSVDCTITLHLRLDSNSAVATLIPMGADRRPDGKFTHFELGGAC